MLITVKRLKSDNHTTVGFMSIDNDPKYFTLEDAYHDTKVYGKTRIPAGEYAVKLRDVGGMTGKYREHYGADFHKGMLWLQDVPNYEYVYVHTGNKAEHTDGCILVGVTCDLSLNGKIVGRSEDAYRQVYPLIRDAILSGEEVRIVITDE